MAVISEPPKSCGKLSHKEWKKQKRKQKRQIQARQQQQCEVQSTKSTDKEEELERKEVEEENQKQNAIWQEKDAAAHEEWKACKEREEKERQRQEEMERKIREEWEERQRRENKEQEEKDKVEKERKDKQENLLREATAHENKEWHNPLAPVRYTENKEEVTREINHCPFFTKTGACRYGERCSRAHLRPDSSTTLLIPGMFQNFELKKSSVDDFDTDMGLEYEDNDLYNSFREFYVDTLPEFKSVGKVINFKVCCNHEAHLRGNVYVQYKRESDAQKAFVKFNARWYAGRQLSIEFVSIAKWKSAICGLFFRKKCPKGKACNFLHVFRNPGNEFWEADQDLEVSVRGRSLHHRNKLKYAQKHRHKPQDRIHRSRSRSKESVRSYRKKKSRSSSKEVNKSHKKKRHHSRSSSRRHRHRSRSRSSSRSLSRSRTRSRSS